MSPEELKQFELMLYKINRLDRSDRYVFEKSIATIAGIKIGFFGVDPIVQQAAISAPSNPTGTYSQSEIQSIVDAVNSIRALLKAYGLSK